LKTLPAVSRKARLVNPDQRPVERARTDRTSPPCAAALSAPELVQFLDGRGEIRVAEKPPLAARFEHAVTHREAFAAVARIPQHADIRIAVCETDRLFESAVG
jgi:hypothetical protein